MNKLDCHDILKIKEGASKEEIKKAFRALAHIHHPDKGGNPKVFKKVLAAYDYLIKREVIGEVRYQTYPYWKDGMIYYWPGDIGTYVGDGEDELSGY